MNRFKVWMGALVLTGFVFADVEQSTSINDVFRLGTSELAGAITMRVNSDDFNGVSPADPIFIRITLGNGALLASTRVNIPENIDPIFLAMRTEDLPGIFLNGPANTVSIVRWVAGEPYIWLRVQQTSEDWIGLGDPLNPTGFEPPSDTSTASWTFGFSARRSFDFNGSLNPNQINLPFNTRDDTVLPGTSDPSASVSTLICVDLSAGGLGSTGVDSLLIFDSIAFDSTAEVSPGIYQPGNQVGIDFTNDFQIARGKERECTQEMLSYGVAGEPVLVGNGLATITNTMSLRLECSVGGNILTTTLERGSFIRYANTTGKPYGFSSDSASYTLGIPGYVVLSDPFTLEGQTLYRRADLIYDDAPSRNFITLETEVTVTYAANRPVKDLLLDWSIVITNHDGGTDAPPFDGPDQYFRCDPSEYYGPMGLWAFGQLEVPTLGTWGLFALVAMLAGAGLVLMRKRAHGDLMRNRSPVLGNAGRR